MKHDLLIQDDIVIPEHELLITTSRAGGPGGQHVNKTNSRITIRWHVKNSNALPDNLKERILQKLHTRLSSEGELIIHNAESSSQLHNKKKALEQLAHIVRKALIVPKKRRPTKPSKAAQESRRRTKTHTSLIKKLRRIKPNQD